MTGFIGLFDTARDYFTVHFYTHTNVLQSCHHCCRLVAASNDWRSPSCVFLNCPWPQLPASNSNSSQQLNPSSFPTHWLFFKTHLSSDRKKNHHSCVAVQLLLSDGMTYPIVLYRPLLSNDQLLWLHNSCFERIYHHMKNIYSEYLQYLHFLNFY
jgi:hypothetical protein